MADNIIVNIQAESYTKAATAVKEYGNAANEAAVKVQLVEDNSQQLNNQLKTTTTESGKTTKNMRDFSGILKQVADGHVTARTAMRDLKQAMVDLALQGKQNTKEYQELKAIAGELKDTIGDVAEEIGQAGSDTRGLDIAIRTMNVGIGVATGLQAATSLFGVENEKVQQTLVKLNAALLLTNAAQQIGAEAARKDSIFSLAAANAKKAWAAATTFLTNASIGLRVALAGIGLLAIAGIVYGIVKAYQALGGQLGENIRLAKLDAETRQKAAKSVKGEVASLYELVAVAKNENISRKDREIAIKKIQAEYPEYLKNISLETIGTDAVNEAIKRQIDLLIKREQLKILTQKKAELDLQLENNDAIKEQITLGQKVEALALKALGLGGLAAVAQQNSFNKAKQSLQQQSDDIAKQIEKILNSLGASPFPETTAKTKKNLEAIKGEGGSILRQVQEEVRLRTEIATLTRVQRDNAREQKDLEIFLRRLEERAQTEDRINEALRERKAEEQKTENGKTSLLDRILGFSAKEFASELEYRIAAAKSFYGNILQFEQDLTGTIISGSQVRTEKEIRALEQRRQRGLISEKQYQKELNKIKNEQAQKEKKAAVAEAFLKIPLVILNALSSVPFPFNIIAAAIAGGLATAQAAILAARPPAQFFKGVINLPLNGNPKGRDTIPAMLNEGESVMTTDETRKYEDALWAMRKGEFDKKYLHRDKLLEMLPKLTPDLMAFPALPAFNLDGQMDVRIGLAIREAIAPELKQLKGVVQEELGYVQNELRTGNSDRRRGIGAVIDTFKNRRNG